MDRFPEVGDCVRIRNPKMASPTPCDFGTVIRIDGAYIAVRPDTWPTGNHIELYPNEIELVERKP